MYVCLLYGYGCKSKALIGSTIGVKCFFSANRVFEALWLRQRRFPKVWPYSIEVNNCTEYLLVTILGKHDLLLVPL